MEQAVKLLLGEVRRTNRRVWGDGDGGPEAEEGGKVISQIEVLLGANAEEGRERAKGRRWTGMKEKESDWELIE